MRMNNPFSSDPGEESSGDEPRDDAAAQPEEDEAPTGAEESEPETNVSEARGDGNGGSATAESEPHGDADSDAEAGDADASDTESGADAGDADSGEPEQKLTAPSVGPHTVIDKPPPEERLDFDRISDIDAMGQEKRREVVGKTYGPTKLRVFATFATFFAVVAALAFGFYLLAQELDAPPAENPDVAPWSAPEAPQQPPRELQ